MTSGEDLRDEGIEQVLGGETWQWKNAYRHLCAEWFAALPTGTVFNGEALRLNAEEHGLEPPHHVNSWGGMAHGYLRSLLAIHWIERVGVSKAQSAKAHARSYPAYRKI